MTLRAQVDMQDTDVIVETYPLNPKPYSDTTITISSYATDMNKAMIEWKSGSKILLSGYGKTKYSFKTLGPNKTISFIVTILPVDSVKQVSKVINITPSDIQILWQAVNGYTPPFYPGKSFVSSQGYIKAVAIPNTIGSNADSKKITYTWTLNDKVQPDASGYGKNYFIFENNVLNTQENVSVSISSLDGSYVGNGSVTIPIVSPEIIFYKKSPSEGILYNNAFVDQTTMTEDEITLVAEPYFLALKGNENDFTYSWQINGSDIDTPLKKSELTVKPESHGGYSTISLKIENLKLLFQEVASNLTINL